MLHLPILRQGRLVAFGSLADRGAVSIEALFEDLDAMAELVELEIAEVRELGSGTALDPALDARLTVMGARASRLRTLIRILESRAAAR